MLCIIQARMSSHRLPGKMMMDLAGRTVLGRVVDRVSRASTVSSVVVATSEHSSDDPIAEFCLREGMPCFRGPLEDVAERFRRVVDQERAEAFIRVTGDSPLIDPALIDRAVGYFRQGDCDLATNVLVRTYPVGQSVEVLLASVFKDTCRKLTTAEQREHVTKAYYETPSRYRILGFTSGMGLGGMNLSVDTASDFETVKAILERSGNRPAGWRELAALCEPK